MSPDQYCQRRVARTGSSVYYSVLLLPAEQRRRITALYAFCREVDEVVDECADTGVARRKLDWWREEIERCFHGHAGHPVTRALQDTVQQLNLPLEYFQEIIDGMEMDLDRRRWESFSDLALYCHRAAGVVWLLSAEIFGYSHRDTLKYAEQLGTAFRLTNILRDVRKDAGRGRIYLPLDELERFGVDPRNLLSGIATEGLHELFHFQARRARQYYELALSQLPDADRYRQRGGLVMAAIYRKLLDEIEADGYRVMEHRVTLTPVRKLWIAWTTVRRERRLQRRRGRQANHA